MPTAYQRTTLMIDVMKVITQQEIF